jgi:photosystem II stability/assembly factor-like uncharacterized protein
MLAGGMGAAVGANGSILRTTDAGATWNRVWSPTPEWLSGVTNNASGTMLAVGGRGACVRSEDGGQAWELLSRGARTWLRGVVFLDEHNGIAVGGDDSVTIVRTTSGGATWRPARVSPGEFLNAVTFLSASVATAVGGDGRILRTTNGGVDWNMQTYGGIASLNGVHFADSENGIAVGEAGTIIITSNGGSTWTPVPSGTTQNLYDVAFCGKDTGLVVGSLGTMLRSTNGGSTWTRIMNGIPFHLYCVSFLDRNIAFAGGRGLYRTSDAGESWVITNRSDSSYKGRGRSMNFTGVVSSGRGRVMATVSTSIVHGESTGELHSSSDSGRTWARDTVLRAGPLRGIARCGETGFTAVGDRGLILHLEDNVNTGTTQDMPAYRAVPERAVLEQNFPNPFNPSTSIRYEVPAAGIVRLSVFDILGRELSVLVNETQAPGRYEVQWNAGASPSGVYVSRLACGAGSLARRMILIR